MRRSALEDLDSYFVPKKSFHIGETYPDRRGSGVARDGLNAQLPLGAAW